MSSIKSISLVKILHFFSDCWYFPEVEVGKFFINLQLRLKFSPYFCQSHLLYQKKNLSINFIRECSEGMSWKFWNNTKVYLWQHYHIFHFSANQGQIQYFHFFLFCNFWPTGTISNSMRTFTMKSICVIQYFKNGNWQFCMIASNSSTFSCQKMVVVSTACISLFSWFQHSIFGWESLFSHN